MDADQAFRKWSPDKDICCVVAVRSDHHRYNTSVGFCSPLIVTWFGLPNPSLPTLAECKLCGIVVGLGDLLEKQLQMGWQVTDENELEIVGVLFRRTLESHLPELLDRFMDIDGWIRHFRQRIESQSFGRGMPWSMFRSRLARQLVLPRSQSRQRPRNLTFHGTEKKITLSVGLCFADRDCFLTDQELLQRGEKAMAFAKEKGRNRIAGYTGKLFDDSELTILVE